MENEQEVITLKNIFFYQTEIGEIGIEENARAITNVYFGRQPISSDATLKETALLKESAKQLNEYLQGNRKVFDLPLEPTGTEFQTKVWTNLLTIPYGQTYSYREVASSIGKEKATRAVGNANNKNPILIFIPCHRVVGSDGKLVGYAGGLEIKKHLLNLEKQYANS